MSDQNQTRVSVWLPEKPHGIQPPRPCIVCGKSTQHREPFLRGATGVLQELTGMPEYFQSVIVPWCEGCAEAFKSSDLETTAGNRIIYLHIRKLRAVMPLELGPSYIAEFRKLGIFARVEKKIAGSAGRVIQATAVELPDKIPDKFAAAPCIRCKRPTNDRFVLVPAASPWMSHMMHSLLLIAPLCADHHSTTEDEITDAALKIFHTYFTAAGEADKAKGPNEYRGREQILRESGMHVVCYADAGDDDGKF